MESRRKVRVVDLDIKGLLNKDYIKNLKSKQKSKNNKQIPPQQLCNEALYETHKNFFDQLKWETAQAGYQQAVMVNGSMLQDHRSDITNHQSNKCGSIFPALDDISSRLTMQDPQLEWAVENYLLADTCAKLEAGMSWQQAVINKPHHPHALAVRDTSKLVMLYTHLHKIAYDFHSADIDFDVYDEHPENIHLLHAFFSENPDLIPQNISLRLHILHDKKQEALLPIQGANSMEKNYHDGCRKMLAAAGMNLFEIEAQQTVCNCDVLGAFNTNKELLAKFKAQRYLLNQMAPPPAVDEAVPEPPPQEDDELSALRMNINLAKAAAAKYRSIEGDAFVAALDEAYRKIQEELSIVKRQKRVTPAKIANSDAMQAANGLLRFVSGLNEAKNQEEKAVCIANFKAGVEKQRFWRRCKHVALTIIVTAAALIVGAGIGFGVGFAAGSLTGPGAVVTAVAGAIFGAIIGAVVGASVMGAGAGLFTGLFVRYKQKPTVATEKAMLEVGLRAPVMAVA